MIKRIEREN